jgi:hypothetical protein
MDERSPAPEPARPTPAAARGRPGWSSVRRHPWITGTLLVCTLAGAAAGFVWLSGEWSVARRLAAGAIAGAGFGFLLTATKMMAE